MNYKHYLKFLKNETQWNTTVRAIAQRLCVMGSDFKRSYAMVGSSGSAIILLWLTSGIVLDASGLFFHCWFYISCVEQVGRLAWWDSRNLGSYFSPDPIFRPGL